MEAFLSVLDQVFGPLYDPKKRVFVGYLISALILAVIWLRFFEKNSISQLQKKLFAKSIWLSKSAKSDYALAIINQLIMMIISPRLFSKLVLATLLFEAMHIWFEGRVQIWQTAPGWLIPLCFTTMLFVTDDLAKYLLHRFLHTIPFLWCFHKVHHSAETLTPITVFRTHPVEGILFALRAIFVQAAVLGSCFFFFGERVQLINVLGANLFLFMFNLLGSNLRHSQIPIRYGKWLEHVLISPAQHHIHHSIETRHYNKNFGAVLAIWDYLGKSLYLSEKYEQYRFGLNDNDQRTHRLSEMYFGPFRDAFYCLIRRRNKKDVKANHAT